MKKKISVTFLIIALLSGVSFGSYIYNNYKIYQGFTPIALSFDPYTSVSTYDWNGAKVRIQGGFVKGIMKDKNNQESLLLRSLSPSSRITLNGISSTNTYPIRLENVNPLNLTIQGGDESFKILNPHTILLALEVGADEEKSIDIGLKNPNSEFVILGDNRNGYQTFANIIDQINAFRPAFVIASIIPLINRIKEINKENGL